MSLFLGDLRIKAALTLGLEDIQKNEWLLEDILGDTVSNPYMAKYYSKEIENCRQWLNNNRINILMSESEDTMEFPAITIEVGSSNEKAEMKHMADLSTERVRLMPNDINRPIPYIVQPTSGSYDPILGTFTFSNLVDLSTIVMGQVLVDPSTGSGYIIQSVLSANQVQLLKTLNLTASVYGIIPEYRFYESAVGHTFMQEEYRVSCKGLNQQTNLWLHSIAVYLLLRYRQTLLEHDGFAESIIKSGKMYLDPKYSVTGQTIWARDITLTGQVENRWLEQPHRVIESVAYEGPLKILSNITDTFENPDSVLWATLAAEAEAGDQ